MAQRLIVEIVGDASKLNRTFKQTSRDAARFEGTIEKTGRTMNRVFAAAGVGIGLGTIVKGLSDSISAASNLNEQMSKSNVVFGKSATVIQDWSRTSARSVLLAQDQAVQAAASFGALLRPLGLTEQAAAQQSIAFTQLAADLASFSNTSVDDALTAIRSGLVGEIEPLRRYGVVLSEAAVQQEALAETGKKSADQLTATEKVAARTTLIMRQTAQAQGDVARTSGSLANQQRQAAANIRDFQILLGTKLVPTLTKVLTKFNEWAGEEDNQRKIADTLDSIGAAIERIANAGERLGRAEQKTKGFFDKLTGGLNDAMAAWAPGWPLVVQGLERLSAAAGGGLVGPVGGGGNFNAQGQPVGGAGAGMPGFSGTLHIPPAPRGATVEQQNTWFDRMIGSRLMRAGLLTDMRAQIAAYEQVAQLIRQRLAVTKDITRQRTLEDQLLQVVAQAGSTRASLADDLRAQAEEAKRTAEQARQAALETRRGWLDFAVERAGATKTITDDVKANRALERWLKERIRQEGRTLELVRDLWQTRQRIRDLNKSKADVDPLAGLIQVSSGKLAAMLAAGTGLGAHGQRILSANVSALEIQSYVHIDGREVGRAVNKDQARTSRRTARQTSGYRG